MAKNILSKIKRGLSFSKITTFKVGGYAKYFVEVKNKDELLQAVYFAKEKSIPILVIGWGSDILVSDKGFDGLVIRLIGNKLRFEEIDNFTLVTADAGFSWDDLVKEAVKRNLQGIECMSGIPGTVGAAPIQNIGAYGQELKDVFVSLVAYDLKLRKFVNFTKRKCKFSYRESIFKEPKNKNRYIITEVKLKLVKNRKPTLSYQSLIDYLKSKNLNSPSISQVRKAVLTLRRKKLEDPKIYGNAGSFFKNPIVSSSKINKLSKKFESIPFFKVENGKYKLFAGWLIEKAGWKGKSFGGAMVSKKNALVILNYNKAKAKDIYMLSRRIISDIQEKFGVRLEPEVECIGFN